MLNNYVNKYKLLFMLYYGGWTEEVSSMYYLTCNHIIQIDYQLTLTLLLTLDVRIVTKLEL